MSSIFLRLLKKSPLAKRLISRTQRNMQNEMPDPFQLSTGKQRKEIKAFSEGNRDPYHMAVIKRGSGTKDNPTLIPSAFNGRIVGCICNENRFVNYMWLEKDCPKRCECGHWYKLKQIDAF